MKLLPLRFNARVAARKYRGLEHQFRIIDEERHARLLELLRKAGEQGLVNNVNFA